MPRVVTFKLDDDTLRRLDCLVRAGLFEHRSEAIREAIRRLLEEVEGEYGDVCSQPARLRLYRCPVCGETLPYHQLRRHVVEQHVLSNVGWRCPLCGKLFEDRVGLLGHLYQAGDERHMLLWAILASKRPRDRNAFRRELLRRLAVEH